MTVEQQSLELTRPRSRVVPSAIQVRDLEKGFRIPTDRVHTLKERVVGAFSRGEHREFQALRGISFEVGQGEFFGIVGRNGSGKSTLLKLLASIYRADSGSISVAGRLAPIIELGVGFNPEMNGRENIVLSGVLMGLTPREAESRVDAILDFAELSEFADLKLKNYSSGMLVRLGFSLMVQVDADVLLIDEVLAVGDAAFQLKCYDAFARMHEQGRTIVLVTHDMSAINSHCDRAMLLEAGEIDRIGDPHDVSRRYFEINYEPRLQTRAPEDTADAAGSKAVEFLDLWLEDARGERASTLELGEAVNLNVRFRAVHRIPTPTFAFQIVNDEGVPLVVPASINVGDGSDLERGDVVHARARVDNRFAPGQYFVHTAVGVADTKQLLAFRKYAGDFVVYSTRPIYGMVDLNQELSAAVERDGGR